VQSVLHNSSLSRWQIGTGEAGNQRRGSGGVRQSSAPSSAERHGVALGGLLQTGHPRAASGLRAQLHPDWFVLGWAHLAQRSCRETGTI